jgi:hypothetical protein
VVPTAKGPSESPSFMGVSLAPTLDHRKFLYPPIVIQIEILLKFELQGMGELRMQLSDMLPQILVKGLGNILFLEVEGHSLVEIAYIESVGDETLFVVIRVVARRECVDCSASALAGEMVGSYETGLKRGASSGGLARQIEFHAFLLDVPGLSNITIDSNSIGTWPAVNAVVNSAAGVADSSSGYQPWSWDCILAIALSTLLVCH